MSVRTTPSGTGDTSSPPRRYPQTPSSTPAAILAHAQGLTTEAPAPAPEPAAPAIGITEPAATEPGVPAPEPEGESRPDIRRALRAARRQRRHVMVGCAVVIAVCVVLTVLIVGIARDRRPGSQVIVPNLSIGAPARPALAAATAEPIALSTTPNEITQTSPPAANPGAPAPEGDQR